MLSLRLRIRTMIKLINLRKEYFQLKWCCRLQDMMAEVSLKLAVLFTFCISTLALKISPPEARTTIFGDERIEGGVFENYKDWDGVVPRNDDLQSYRLPTTTKPLHYEIIWTFDTEILNFGGSVTIQIQATEENVNQIVLHSEDLNIITVRLTQENNIIPQTVSYDEEQDFLIVNLNSTVLDQNVIYTLSIDFNAPLRTDMYGIYRSWFKNNYTDTASWMATTQFQATAARKAFPCYDEPSFKATFDITIRRPTTHKSWSCTRIESTTALLPGFEDDKYLTTPIMSTYLLALIVADYETIPHYDTDGTTLLYEVIARENAISQGQYAFDVGQLLLGNMSEHTNIDFYSVSSNLKMTQAAIPDFSAGAMENWGLLTYREAYVLYEEGNTNSYFKQLIAYILSHEIAHMWFGNLVTCDWWDVLWLNEGFAGYYQYFLTYWVEDMGLETRFIIEQIHTALLSDSANTHPLTNPGVGSPSEVSAMFSTISYNKGAAVIRMTEHLLGFEVHREGLRQYLEDFSFETVKPINLFESLQNAAVAANALSEYPPDFSVIDYYNSWTEQPGHPVLQVQVNHGTGDMTISQRRFNINTGYSTANLNYIIPITFATASNPDFEDTKPTHILSSTVAVINRGSTGDEWVVFNKKQTGFYRVNYDDYTWNLIALALRGPDRILIHKYNRAQIVNDVFQFARSGLMTYSRALNILSFLEYETEYAPWVAAMVGFSWLRTRLIGSPYLTELEDLIVEWSTNVMADIGYVEDANEDFMRSYLRYQLAPVMCSMNVRACRDEANRQFRNLIDNSVEVPVDSRNWVYCNGLREGSASDFNALWERFQTHNVYTEKILILLTIGCTPHEAQIIEFMDAIVNDNEIVRPQDYNTALSSAVSGNEENTQIVFQYIKDNFESVNAAWVHPRSIVDALSYVSSRLRTDEEIDDYLEWAATVQTSVTEAEYSNIVSLGNTARNSLRWTETIVGDLNNYLENGGDTIEASTSPPVVPEETITEQQPESVAPESPNIDSAVTAVISLFAILLAVIANLIV